MWMALFVNQQRQFNRPLYYLNCVWFFNFSFNLIIYIVNCFVFYFSPLWVCVCGGGEEGVCTFKSRHTDFSCQNRIVYHVFLYVDCNQPTDIEFVNFLLKFNFIYQFSIVEQRYLKKKYGKYLPLPVIKGVGSCNQSFF